MGKRRRLTTKKQSPVETLLSGIRSTPAVNPLWRTYEITWEDLRGLLGLRRDQYITGVTHFQRRIAPPYRGISIHVRRNPGYDYRQTRV